MSLRLNLFVLSLVFVAGCASAPAAPPTFAPDLAVDLDAMTRTSSGLYIQDVKVGSGEPARRNRTVFLHYTGWLSDGRMFDTSRRRNRPIDFILGREQVIDGWDEGVEGMQVGGVRRLVVPPHLGYGGRGVEGSIPRHATLVFEIELVDVR